MAESFQFQETATRSGRDKSILPHSIEAEQAVIGSLLLDNEARNDVGDRLSEQDFFRDDHRRIFLHIMGLLEREGFADVVTVSDSIQKSNEEDQTGGLKYLKYLVDAMPSPGNIRQSVEIVRDKAILRSIIDLCDEVASRAINYDPDRLNAQMFVDLAYMRLSNLSETLLRAPRIRQTLSAAMDEAIDRVRTLSERSNKDEVTGIATGYVDLDKMTSGFQRGDLVVFAGRPGMGKTTLALNVAEHVSVDLGLPTLIFSLDLTAQPLALRFLSSLARVDLDKLHSAQLTDGDWGKLTSEIERLHDAKIYFDVNGMIKVPELRAQIRRAYREYKGLGLIVIGDIQMIDKSNEPESISRELKRLAKELDVPIIVLSSLPRNVEERTDKRPLLSDLRETSEIHQDADLILLLYRGEYYFPDASKESGMTEVHIAKNLHGPTGELCLTFNKEYCRFESLRA